MAQLLDQAVSHIAASPHLALLLLFPLLLLLLLRNATSTGASKKPSRCPPSPPKLPIIGHLHLVGANPHVSLRDLSRKYGPDFMLLHLGAVPTIIVASPRAAQAIMRTHDHVFASRVRSRIVDIVLYGAKGVAFAPYGESWRQAKKLVTTHLLNVKKVQAFRLARQEEVQLVMAKIQEAAGARGAPVNMSEVLNSFSNDIVCRAVSGKFFREEGRNKMFREMIEMELFGGFNIEDYFPSLARIGLLTRVVCARARVVHQRWDELLDEVINDHAKGGSCTSGQENDFVDVMLSRQQEYGLTTDHIKAILMDMFAAGTDTSYITLEAAMAELMQNEQLMLKLQTEVRGIVKGKEMVTEDDLGNMTYLKAVVKETLRLHPPGPLLLPHISMEDCTVEDYKIPSGTRVIINVWAIGRHPESWEAAEEFRPERFLSGGEAAVDFRGQDFQLLPFGSGRRICPGINFGTASVEMMLANLAYHFDWELPPGIEKGGLDMSEVFGLSLHRKEKLLLVPKFRDAGFS